MKLFQFIISRNRWLYNLLMMMNHHHSHLLKLRKRKKINGFVHFKSTKGRMKYINLDELDSLSFAFLLGGFVVKSMKYEKDIWSCNLEHRSPADLWHQL